MSKSDSAMTPEFWQDYVVLAKNSENWLEACDALKAALARCDSVPERNMRFRDDVDILQAMRTCFYYTYMNMNTEPP